MSKSFARFLLVLSLLIWAALWAYQPAIAQLSSATAMFQNGLSPSTGYSGASDTYLSENQPTANFGTAPELRVDGDDPVGSGQNLYSLMRWDVSAIAPGSVVESVSITIVVVNPTIQAYPIYRLTRNWVDRQANWNISETGINWELPGASGTTDHSSTVLGTVQVNANGKYTFPLNSAGISVVQDWVNNPSSNYGLMIGDTNLADGLAFYASNTSTAANRPLLSITYSQPSGNTLTPSPSEPATTNTATTTATKTPTANPTVPPINNALVSLTFDDGDQSIYGSGYPILNARGIPATLYIITGSLSTQWRTQLLDLEAHGWEIGSHSVNHLALDTLTIDQMDYELSQSKTDLLAAGLNVTGFAYPYGAGSHNSTVLQETARFYTYARSVNAGYNSSPFTTYALFAMMQNSSVSVETMKSWVDTAIANNQWVIIGMHQVDDTGNTYSISIAELTELANYIQSKVNAGSIRAVTVREGFAVNGTPSPTPSATATITPTLNPLTPTLTPTPTATINPEPFNFVSWGDGQNLNWNLSNTADQVKTLNPAFTIFNGDLENWGVIASEMDPMVAVLKNASLFDQTFMVRGNHDNALNNSDIAWENYFETAPNIKTLPPGVTNYVSMNSNSDYLTYSFDFGNSRFIGVDVPGDTDLVTSAELAFANSRLADAETSGLTHAFLFWHGPIYCTTSDHCNCSSANDSSCTPASIINLINNHPLVSATFHGHEHLLSWTHMDSTRVAGLAHEYEQFLTSPAGGYSYNSLLYPARVDYAYMDMEDAQGFARITVDGDSFTVNFYKVGTTSPVWSRTFTKSTQPANTPTATATITFTPSPMATNTYTPGPTTTNTFTPSPTATNTPAPGATATNTFTPTATVTNTYTPTATNTLIPTATATNTFTPTATATNTLTLIPTATDTFVPTDIATNTYTPTPTAINTFTPTITATNTFTPTATNSRTPTATSTPTQTRTPTRTPTSAPTFTPTPFVMRFQRGALPSSAYNGVRDTYLSQNVPATNYGRDVVLKVSGNEPAGSGKDLSTLLRWDVSAIPTGSQVVSVTLKFNVITPGAQKYEIFRVLRDWSEIEATWNLATSLVPWQTGGANGTLDRGTTVLGTLSSGVTGQVSIKLNSAGIAVVQDWINNPAGNFGLIIYNASNRKGLTFSSSETPTVSNRPLLEITYR